jgi:hypothetical protein
MLEAAAVALVGILVTVVMVRTIQPLDQVLVAVVEVAVVFIAVVLRVTVVLAAVVSVYTVKVLMALAEQHIQELPQTAVKVLAVLAA